MEEVLLLLLPVLIFPLALFGLEGVVGGAAWLLDMIRDFLP